MKMIYMKNLKIATFGFYMYMYVKKIRLKKILSIVLNVLNKHFCLHFSKCYQ